MKKPEKNSDVTDNMRMLLRGREAAALCGCSLRTWRTWESLGFTPQPIHVGCAIFWRYKELEQWIDAGCPKRDDWVCRAKKSK